MENPEEDQLIFGYYLKSIKDRYEEVRERDFPNWIEWENLTIAEKKYICDNLAVGIYEAIEYFDINIWILQMMEYVNKKRMESAT